MHTQATAQSLLDMGLLGRHPHYTSAQGASLLYYSGVKDLPAAEVSLRSIDDAGIDIVLEGTKQEAQAGEVRKELPRSNCEAQAGGVRKQLPRTTACSTLIQSPSANLYIRKRKQEGYTSSFLGATEQQLTDTQPERPGTKPLCQLAHQEAQIEGARRQPATAEQQFSGTEPGQFCPEFVYRKTNGFWYWGTVPKRQKGSAPAAGKAGLSQSLGHFEACVQSCQGLSVEPSGPWCKAIIERAELSKAFFQARRPCACLRWSVMQDAVHRCWQSKQWKTLKRQSYVYLWQGRTYLCKVIDPDDLRRCMDVWDYRKSNEGEEDVSLHGDGSRCMDVYDYRS
eukprot:1158371-Pelagomonas_calceolata.AAC.9